MFSWVVFFIEFRVWFIIWLVFPEVEAVVVLYATDSERGPFDLGVSVFITFLCFCGTRWEKKLSRKTTEEESTYSRGSAKVIHQMMLKVCNDVEGVVLLYCLNNK